MEFTPHPRSLTGEAPPSQDTIAQFNNEALLTIPTPSHAAHVIAASNMLETLTKREISAIVDFKLEKGNKKLTTTIQKELFSIKENTIGKEEAPTLIETEIEINNENSKLEREEDLLSLKETTVVEPNAYTLKLHDTLEG